jgi:hypothetical protein
MSQWNKKERRDKKALRFLRRCYSDKLARTRAARYDAPVIFEQPQYFSIISKMHALAFMERID